MSHALLSPSSSARWTTCTGSVARIEELRAAGKIPPEDSSRFADEGTRAHEYAANALVMGWCDGVIPDRITELHVKSYVDYVESHVTGDGQLHVEERVPLFYYPRDPDKVGVFVVWQSGDGDQAIYSAEDTDGGKLPIHGTKEFVKAECERQGYQVLEYGTVDAWVYHPGESGKGHLHVFDYKNGVIEVEAEGNTQEAIYGESLIQSHPELKGISMDAQVTMHIKQPNVLRGDPTKSWTVPRRELQDFCDEEIQPAADTINKCDHAWYTEIVPSDKACQFCPAKPFCAEHAAWKLGKTVAPAFEEACYEQRPYFFETGEMNMFDRTDLGFEEQVAIALVYLDGGFVSWMKKVVESVQDQLHRGVATSDKLKIVRSKKHKTWTDATEAAKVLQRKLGKAIYGEPKLVTPTQAEKMLATEEHSKRFWNKFNALVIRPEGGITLALDSDPREAVKPIDAATEFGEVEEDLL